MKKTKRLSFHPGYIILPAVIFILSIAAADCFYRLLPPEVAYHFEPDGSPDKWLSRATITTWLLVPQLLLTLLAIGFSLLITRMATLFGQAETTIKLERIMLFMGNLIALPQIVLLFAMLYIFSYNAYQIHIMPMWLFMLIILGLVTIALAILLILFILKSRQKIPQPKD